MDLSRTPWGALICASTDRETQWTGTCLLSRKVKGTELAAWSSENRARTDTVGLAYHLSGNLITYLILTDKERVSGGVGVDLCMRDRQSSCSFRS